MSFAFAFCIPNICTSVIGVTCTTVNQNKTAICYVQYFVENFTFSCCFFQKKSGTNLFNKTSKWKKRLRGIQIWTFRVHLKENLPQIALNCGNKTKLNHYDIKDIVVWNALRIKHQIEFLIKILLYILWQTFILKCKDTGTKSVVFIAAYNYLTSAKLLKCRAGFLKQATTNLLLFIYFSFF